MHISLRKLYNAIFKTLQIAFIMRYCGVLNSTIGILYILFDYICCEKSKWNTYGYNRYLFQEIGQA